MRRTILLAALLIAGLFQSSAKANIRVGWQTGVVNAILTYAVETGKFKKRGVAIELRPFPAGPAMLPALAAGEIDFGWMGEFPATVGFANGLPIQIVLVQSMLRTDVRLVANRSMKIENITDLKGKKIGVTLGSTSHDHLLLALKSAGLSENDVTLVNLAPAAMVPAYTEGQIDAAFTWEPGSGELEKQGGKVLATTESLGAVTGLFGVINTGYLAKNSDEVQKFLLAWSDALADYYKDPSAVLAYEAKRLSQTVEQLRALITRQGAIFPQVNAQLSPAYLGSKDNPSDSRLLAQIRDIGQFLLDNKRINRLPPSFDPLVNPAPVETFIQTSAK
jgi:aliphatic sulfonates family ABC transporter substrate-binding protein